MWQTEDDGDFTRGLAEGVGLVLPGADDERAVDGGPEPGAVRVPPQRALLPLDGEPVLVAAAGPDGALRHELRPVRPPRPHLPDAVPVQNEPRKHKVITSKEHWSTRSM